MPYIEYKATTTLLQSLRAEEVIPPPGEGWVLNTTQQISLGGSEIRLFHVWSRRRNEETAALAGAAPGYKADGENEERTIEAVHGAAWIRESQARRTAAKLSNVLGIPETKGFGDLQQDTVLLMLTGILGKAIRDGLISFRFDAGTLVASFQASSQFKTYFGIIRDGQPVGISIPKPFIQP